MVMEFDTLVVGGGSAGCVVASRLSEDAAHRVGLVEAGPDYGPADGDAWPEELASALYRPGSHDWGYVTNAHGRLYQQFRGRVIGGSSTINAAGITWPTRADLDAWEAMGLPGWGFEALLPFLQRVEADRDGAWPGHGRNGYLPVVTIPTSTPLIADLEVALERLGFPRLIDYNDPDARAGYAFGGRNVQGMRRVHLAAAYLDPARDRPNLTILAERLVDRVTWRGGRVVSVVTQHQGAREELRADRIVLTAGAIGTPTILQRSGIGAADTLRGLLGPMGPLHDLPGVGHNAWDQPGIAVEYAAAEGAYERLAAARQSRPAGSGSFGALVAKLKTDPGLEWFDLHTVQRHVGGPPPPPRTDFFASQIFLLEPAEPGSVCIASLDPDAAPRIEGGVGAAADLERLARAVELERRLVATEPLATWIGPEMRPGATVTGDDLRSWVHDHLELYHHFCGTAKAGPATDHLAVVDHTGRVYGFENLWIADASILPTIPRAAIHLPVLGLAEMISYLLREQ